MMEIMTTVGREKLQLNLLLPANIELLKQLNKDTSDPYTFPKSEYFAGL